MNYPAANHSLSYCPFFCLVLQLLLRKKAAEELKKEQERKAEERRRIIAERCGQKKNTEGANEGGNQFYSLLYDCELHTVGVCVGIAYGRLTYNDFPWIL